MRFKDKTLDNHYNIYVNLNESQLQAVLETPQGTMDRAFVRGFNGEELNKFIPRNTLAWAVYKAGREYIKHNNLQEVHYYIVKQGKSVVHPDGKSDFIWVDNPVSFDKMNYYVEIGMAEHYKTLLKTEQFEVDEENEIRSVHLSWGVGIYKSNDDGTYTMFKNNFDTSG